MNRARITLTDLIYFLIAVVALAAFQPVVNEQLNQNAGSMNEGTILIIQTVLPVAILILMAVIYVKAGIGAR